MEIDAEPLQYAEKINAARSGMARAAAASGREEALSEYGWATEAGKRQLVSPIAFFRFIAVFFSTRASKYPAQASWHTEPSSILFAVNAKFVVTAAIDHAIFSRCDLRNLRQTQRRLPLWALPAGHDSCDYRLCRLYGSSTNPRSGPYAMALASNERLAVADYGASSVLVFSNKGALLFRYPPEN